MLSMPCLESARSGFEVRTVAGIEPNPLEGNVCCTLLFWGVGSLLVLLAGRWVLGGRFLGGLWFGLPWPQASCSLCWLGSVCKGPSLRMQVKLLIGHVACLSCSAVPPFALTRHLHVSTGQAILA